MTRLKVFVNPCNLIRESSTHDMQFKRIFEIEGSWLERPFEEEVKDVV